MAQKPQASRTTAVKASNDIYTVLVSIGLFAVLGTIAFTVLRCIELFETPFPGIG